MLIRTACSALALTLLFGCSESPSGPPEDSTPPDISFNAISSGSLHTCALDQQGQAWCWGSNASGELGAGAGSVECHDAYSLEIDLKCSRTPVRAGGSLTFAGISVGSRHTCAVTSDGTAYCWGNNEDAQLGTGDTGAGGSTPVPVAGGLHFQSVSAGLRHSCGVTDEGDAYCWGDNSFGQLGGAPGEGSAVPVRALPGHRVSAISASSGRDYTCAVTESGEAFCWGKNVEGVVSLDQPWNSALPPSPVLADYAPVQTISAGAQSACALTTDGESYCWGFGHGSQVERVSSTTRFEVVSSGGNARCGLSTSGTAFCWGGDAYGALGNGPGGFSGAPAPVSGGHSFMALSTGFNHSCALTESGDAYCWGWNGSGQGGNGTIENSEVPVAVTMPTPAQ